MNMNMNMNMNNNKYVFLCFQVLDDSSGLVGFGADIDWREVETHNYNKK